MVWSLLSCAIHYLTVHGQALLYLDMYVWSFARLAGAIVKAVSDHNMVMCCEISPFSDKTRDFQLLVLSGVKCNPCDLS
jgi:hypothetical protein